MENQSISTHEIIASNGDVYNYQVLNVEKMEVICRKDVWESEEKYDKYFITNMDQDVRVFKNGKIILQNQNIYLFDNEVSFLAYLNNKGLLFRQKKMIPNYPNKQYEYFPGGERLVSIQVSEDYKNLVIKFAPKVPTKHSKVFLYKINESKYLYPHSLNGFRIFRSISDLEQIIDRNNLFKQAGPDAKYRMIYGRNYLGESFIKERTTLINKLPQLLSADPSIFNFKQKNLIQIDKLFYENVIDSDFADQIFLPLLAYFGETIVRELNAEWDLYNSKILDIWVPDIRLNLEHRMIFHTISHMTNHMVDKMVSLYSAFNRIKHQF